MKNAKRFSWSEYFDDENKVDRTHNGTALYDTSSYNNYHVFYCNFEECTERGAIYIRRDNEIFTLLEDYAFNRCQSTSEGGSIYYLCSEGHIVQQRNCYFKSITPGYSLAFEQVVKTSSTNKNYAFDISVSNCGVSEREGHATIGIAFGDVQIKNNNITYNKCYDCSSIYNSLDGTSGYCNFTTFRENNQSETISLHFGCNYDPYLQTVSYCNVIGNKCGTNWNQVLFDCSYNTTVDHCVFLNNTAKYMFDIGAEGTLTITNSYVERKTTTGDGTVMFESDKSNPDSINILHFYVENCYIEPKLLTAKFSYFCKFAQTSPALLSSKKS